MNPDILEAYPDFCCDCFSLPCQSVSFRCMISGVSIECLDVIHAAAV